MNTAFLGFDSQQRIAPPGAYRPPKEAAQQFGTLGITQPSARSQKAPQTPAHNKSAIASEAESLSLQFAQLVTKADAFTHIFSSFFV
ncbi:hypothetical protein [Tateyamaria sp.]|uniref:hypothetical protein n=1 Tax=Tateyamaria sp. TaxID=1929288 RepID=UPI00329DD858